MIKSTKAFLLAGASALAILACAAEANAETFTVPGMFSFAVSVSGEYAVELLGASGGNSGVAAGGLGAKVSGDIFLTAGEDLSLFVGGQGGSAAMSGGGGGGSFVFGPMSVLAVAGGGGGGGINVDGQNPPGAVINGGPGLVGTSGGIGGNYDGRGGVGGAGGYASGGNGGGGGGAGVKTGPAGYGSDSLQAGIGGYGGRFPNGGAGGIFGGGRGGFGGGGGGGYGGGGGSGFSGGGGSFSGGGGGGGSYLASLFTDQVLTTGGASRGDGSISITTVPEPSTWAMMLMGFAGLGWLMRTRGRKTSPA
jgi:hypothetical protein